MTVEEILANDLKEMWVLTDYEALRIATMIRANELHKQANELYDSANVISGSGPVALEFMGMQLREIVSALGSLAMSVSEKDRL